MVALLLCYHFTVLCASKCDISASAIYSIWRYFLINYYIGRRSEASLAASTVFPIAFISLFPLAASTVFPISFISIGRVAPGI